MMEENNQGQNQNRPFINTQLDFNIEVIEPSWGKATPSMLNRTKDNLRYVTCENGKYIGVMPAEGQIFICVEDILTNLDYFPKDIRLSNYDEPDIKSARWYLDFAVACAHYKYFGPFNYCLGKVANISETSQGRKGFLRKMLNTFRTENLSTPLEPSKRSFFTGKIKGE